MPTNLSSRSPGDSCFIFVFIFACAEIPLFHVLSAKVSFSNVNGHKSPVAHVSLSSTRKREATVGGPAPQLTPTPSSPVEVGGVKRRHGQAGSKTASELDTSVDPPTLEGGSGMSDR